MDSLCAGTFAHQRNCTRAKGDTVRITGISQKRISNNLYWCIQPIPCWIFFLSPGNTFYTPRQSFSGWEIWSQTIIPDFLVTYRESEGRFSLLLSPLDHSSTLHLLHSTRSSSWVTLLVGGDTNAIWTAFKCLLCAGSSRRSGRERRTFYSRHESSICYGSRGFC